MNEPCTIRHYRRLMIARRVKSLLFILLWGVSSLSIAISSKADTDNDVVVIVPQDSTVDSLSKTSLRAIFGMRSRTWPQGGAIKVFVLEDDNPLHATFAKQLLQTFPFNLRRIWDRRVYSGIGQSPAVVKTEQEMLNKVSETENSIGYILRNRVDAGVKVVNLQ